MLHVPLDSIIESVIAVGGFYISINDRNVYQFVQSRRSCACTSSQICAHQYSTESKRPGGYSHTLPIRVCAAQRGRDFKAPGLERGIHFRGVF